jgi:hypothetical protein
MAMPKRQCVQLVHGKKGIRLDWIVPPFDSA